MKNDKLSSADLMKILGCFIFDIGITLAYFQIFGLFLIIAPIKSMLILFVLLMGLLILNGAIIYPSMIFRTIGIPYTAGTVTLCILYAIISNAISIFLIPGTIIGYVVWELIIFAIFIIIFSVIGAFSKTTSEEAYKAEKEQTEKTLIMLQLLEVENALNNKENQEEIMKCRSLFNALKERIKASTPFGRISGNNAVFQVENQIKENLVSIKLGFQEDLTDKTLAELERLLEDTRRLVMNRETLNIK